MKVSRSSSHIDLKNSEYLHNNPIIHIRRISTGEEASKENGWMSIVVMHYTLTFLILTTFILATFPNKSEITNLVLFTFPPLFSALQKRRWSLIDSVSYLINTYFVSQSYFVCSLFSNFPSLFYISFRNVIYKLESVITNQTVNFALF